MRDQFRTLLLSSFKDAREIVAEYNEWSESAFGDEGGVPAQAVPQIALSLYQSRVMQASSGADFDLPEFDERMYE